MVQDGKLVMGFSQDEMITITPKMINRHGIISGATGTGKTVSLKVLAEGLSELGIPVFLSDIKGDLSGFSSVGIENENIRNSIDTMGLSNLGFNYKSFPSEYFDIFQEKGIPLRTTISEIGPLLLSSILGLTEVQSGVLHSIFRICDDKDDMCILTDIKDLKAALKDAYENSSEYSSQYGNISKQTIGVIERKLLVLEDQGGNLFFGEPAFNVADFMTRSPEGMGMINILNCQKLIMFPQMYSAFMLWLLSELYENLPEVGDLDRPKLVFFFDEAHLLFDKASDVLKEKITQVIKLIRSKGVGIFFITQIPTDIPDEVLSQLGTKVQHALHAYTPKEQKALRSVADSFRVNPEFQTIDVLQELGIGEALFSSLDESGIPTIVKKTKILPPMSLIGPIGDEKRDTIIRSSLLFSRYFEPVDGFSAYEFFMRHNLEKEALEERALEEAKAQKLASKESERRSKKRSQATKSVMKSVTGTLGREVGKTIGSSVGGRFGRTLGGNVGASLGRGILETLFRR